jgi:hypothetical protein
VRAQLPDYATWQTQMRAQAIDLVNGARHRAGLSPVTEQTALDQSTEAHAMYWLFNEADPTTRKLGIHLETPGLFGYVGSSSYVRALHFGLRPAGTLEDITHATDVPHSISDWVDSVFHRFAIMAPEALTAGYSLEQVGALPIQVLDVATGGRANSSAVVLYPSPGQSDVPVAFFGNELPDPTPEATANHLYPVGYPITATFSESASVSVSHSTFTDAQGKALEYWELEPNTGDMGNNWAIVPKAPLTPGATYHVSFAGTLNGQSLHRDWSFTTGSS